MPWDQWAVIGIAVTMSLLAVVSYIRHMAWIKRNQSKIDEAYDWLKGYYRKDDD